MASKDSVTHDPSGALGIHANAPTTHTALTWQELLRQEPSALRVHLIGIGGAGLGPIARVLLQMGVSVSGSDRRLSPATQALVEAGATVSQEGAANLLDLAPEARPHVVLISSAVAPDNPERQAADSLGLPVVKRSDFLPVLLDTRTVVAVAGTHGKTTTTGMIAHILHHAGLEPGYIIGAEIPGLGNAAAGRTQPPHAISDNPAYFVIEADEYDYMFLGLHPTIAVVTNVEWDHPDCFPTADSFFDAFRRFLAQVRPQGHIVSCHDDAGAETLRREISDDKCRGPHATAKHQTWTTYGFHDAANTRAVMNNDGANPDLEVAGTIAGPLSLAVPGLHNVRNALAAVTAAGLCGIPADHALAALATFRGAGRRFEIVGQVNDITVIDDYGHHPSEVAVTLAAARSRYPDRTIHAVFQPHTYSRTLLLYQEMAASFADADRALITDIFAAREQDDGSIHARQIVEASDHPHMVYTGDLEATTRRLIETVQPGDVVITFSAGDGNQVGRALLAHLAQSSEHNAGVQNANMNEPANKVSAP